MTAPGASRREFLAASASATVASWLAPTTSIGTPVRTIPFLDEGAFPVERTIGAGLGRRRALDLSTLSPETLLTPRDRFFVRTGCPVALPPVRSWKVRVHGLVEAPVELALDELTREAVPLGVHLLECAGNSRAAHFGLMSAASWTGVPLQRLLTRARLRAKATQVLVSGFDEHTMRDAGSVPGASWIFGLEQIRKSGAFLATRMNGAPLRPDHGYPLRLVVPGWYGCTAIKWVNEIVLIGDDAVATDHMREYAGRTHQPPVGPSDETPLARNFEPATIDPAALPVRVEMISGTSCRIVGILWGGAIPRRALTVRLDSGSMFAPVELMGGGLPGAWSLWSYTFRPPAPGRYRIELAIKDRAVRARRLDAGFYAREIEIAGV